MTWWRSPRNRRSSENEAIGPACHTTTWPPHHGARAERGRRNVSAMPDDNPYLIGNFAPVTEELTVERPLAVDGAIPPVLEGLLVRNGPNPVAVDDPAAYHWFSGDGMVHAVELRDGQALSYRNRWVRTRKLAAAAGTPRPPGPPEPIDGPANTHVVWHGGRLLALVESGFPHRLTTELATVCVDDFDGALDVADDRPSARRPGNGRDGVLRLRRLRAAVPPLPRARPDRLARPFDRRRDPAGDDAARLRRHR